MDFSIDDALKIVMRGTNKEDKIAALSLAQPAYADPEKTVRKLLEIASSVEAVQDGRIHMEKVNAPSLLRDKDTRAECGAGPKLAIEGGRPSMHESGTFVKFTQAGADLLAQRRL